jgi:hypothetical protein
MEFPKISDGKVKEGIFIEPQIREIINDDLLGHLLTEICMANVCLNFLGNVKAENYQELVEDLLNACQVMGCNMRFKIHFLHSPLELLPSEPERSERRTW